MQVDPWAGGQLKPHTLAHAADGNRATVQWPRNRLVDCSFLLGARPADSAPHAPQTYP